ncbi:hypothetical protein ACOME3_004449 [Neoechinorhynchus agilis]
MLAALIPFFIILTLVNPFTTPDPRTSESYSPQVGLMIQQVKYFQENGIALHGLTNRTAWRYVLKGKPGLDHYAKLWKQVFSIMGLPEDTATVGYWEIEPDDEEITEPFAMLSEEGEKIGTANH